ncbi:ATP-binding protein [Cytobacillus purgationiresistens]|uniref:Magnesium chelatase subunit I n=1 Tax=Cytobacillus purgationiresistens TaxID=863449 RepID=A0ABU0AQN6_9BACI|nr:AAA family ATPase [Cytobacillus purgationiresistens]MDQ0273583.1 magnesium chelatase subunit I [Cytobacillus purgationiresistens]
MKNYPFTAIVGQEKMKKALIINGINPKIGGVLIQGEKGTAKSTAVRALADVLPDISVVNLPVSATEDRVVGTLDMERILKTGEKKLEPGILAKADGNILYVDEVNLLEDHLVDILLDTAAMGVNRIEREGVSYEHSSRFVLVGTMNPEEGMLRPQLLDRFGLCVNIESEKKVEERMEVIRRRLHFERNQEAFEKRYEQDQRKLKEQIQWAQKLLPTVEIDDALIGTVAELSIELGIESHRADITVITAAQTLAAWKQRAVVQLEDIYEAAELSLPHRLLQDPMKEKSSYEELVELLRYKVVDNK